MFGIEGLDGSRVYGFGFSFVFCAGLASGSLLYTIAFVCFLEARFFS